MVIFCQCQGIMAITETDEIDFIVYTQSDLHIETIKFEKRKWYQDILPSLSKLYFKYISSEVFKTI